MPNDYKIYHMAVKYIKWPKIFQQNPLQDLQKFTQIGIFGFKIYHLATLPNTYNKIMFNRAIQEGP
jgi:hypothetical protein